MTRTKSFLQVFEKMDWPEEEYSFPTLSEYSKEIEADRTVPELESGVPECLATAADIAGTLPRIVSLLNDAKTRTLLAEALWTAAFSRSDSVKAVDLLRRQFGYFSERRLKPPPQGPRCSHNIVPLFNLDHDIPMFGQIVAPILASGDAVSVIISDDTANLFIDFFTHFRKLLDKADLPANAYNLMSVPTADLRVCEAPPMKSAYCPMIVHEDSDLDSAVDCAIHAAWDFGGKLSWSLTHVLVQESVFDEVVGRMIAKLKLLKHGSRLCPSTDLDESENFEETMDFLKMKVYPDDNRKCRHRVFIGWDPWLMKGHESRVKGNGVAVLAFRTADEAIEMVNNNADGYSAFVASVWTDRLSKASVASKRLNVSTVWINSYGLLDPSVEFQPKDYYVTKGTRYRPRNDCTCECIRTRDDDDSIDDRSDYDFVNRFRERCAEIPSPRSYDIVEEALKAQKMWSALTMEERIGRVRRSVNTDLLNLADGETFESVVGGALAAVGSDRRSVVTCGDYDVTRGWRRAAPAVLLRWANWRHTAGGTLRFAADALAAGSAVLTFSAPDVGANYSALLKTGGEFLPAALVRFCVGPPPPRLPYGCVAVPTDGCLDGVADDYPLSFAKSVWTPAE